MFLLILPISVLAEDMITLGPILEVIGSIVTAATALKGILLFLILLAITGVNPRATSSDSFLLTSLVVANVAIKR